MNDDVAIGLNLFGIIDAKPFDCTCIHLNTLATNFPQNMAIFAYSTIAELLTLYVATKFVGLVFDPSYHALVGLNYYLPPDLEQVDGIKTPKQHQRKPNAKKKKKMAEKEKSYLTSKRLDSFVLFQDKVTDENFTEYAKHFLLIQDLQWIFVLALQTLLVNIVSHISNCLDSTPKNIDLATILLCFMAYVPISVNVKLLSKRSAKHFDTQAAIVLGIVASVLAFGILHLPPTIIDFRLDYAMPELNRNVKKILVVLSTPEDQIVDSMVDPLYVRVLIAVICGIITCSYVLPAIRMSKYYNEMVNAEGNGFMLDLSLHISYFSPLFLLLLWVPPLTADFVLEKGLVQCNEHDLIRDCNSFPPSGYVFMTESLFYTLRLYLLLFSSLVAFCLLRKYLQAHLEEAKLQVNEIMHTVSNIDQAMIQRISYGVKQIFWRVCVVGIQYCGPLMFHLSLALLLHRKGNHDLHVCNGIRYGLRHRLGWEHVGTPNAFFNNSHVTPEVSAGKSIFTMITGESDEAQQILTWVRDVASIQVFTPNFYRPVIGFIIFWSLLSWFTLSAFGLMYYRRQQLFAQVVPKNMSLVPPGTGAKGKDTNSGGPVIRKNEWGKARKKYQAQ